MIRLSKVEKECQMVLTMISEMMSPGKGSMSHVEHTELCGRVRDCVRKLQFKEHGCVLGIHSERCKCKEWI